MRSPFVYIKNFIGMTARKIRFGSHLSAGFIQTFDRLHVEIRNGGYIRIGQFDQNRGDLYLICDGGNLTIGDHCFFNTGSSVTAVENVTIGSGCKFGNNTVIVEHDHNFKNIEDENGNVKEFISSPVKIGNNVWVGANVTILRGTDIGDECVIAAGSVVKGTVPSGTRYIRKDDK